MATIAERLLPADGSVLSYTLDTLGNADFEIERLVVHDSEEVMPCVGTTGVDADELERIVRPDEAVSYRMHWVESIETLVHILPSRRGRSPRPTNGATRRSPGRLAQRLRRGVRRLAQALSERIRRSHETLVGNSVIGGRGENEEDGSDP